MPSARTLTGRNGDVGRLRKQCAGVLKPVRRWDKIVVEENHQVAGCWQSREAGIALRAQAQPAGDDLDVVVVSAGRIRGIPHGDDDRLRSHALMQQPLDQRLDDLGAASGGDDHTGGGAPAFHRAASLMGPRMAKPM